MHVAKLAPGIYDYNLVRPPSSLGNQAPTEPRRALELNEGCTPGAGPKPKTKINNIKSADSHFE
jgi:hypothetical protein